MSEKLIVTFDKSAEDIPVLVVAKEGFGWGLTSEMRIVNTLTGENAETAYKLLTKKGDKE